MKTRLTEMLNIEHPVMLAGMGGVAYSALAAAVSNAGGYGCLGASTMSSERLAKEIAARFQAVQKGLNAYRRHTPLGFAYYGALTARDRPYKTPKRLSECIAIMARMSEEQHIDSDLFALFLGSGVYREYAEAFLLPEQIDEVDLARYFPRAAAAAE